MSTPTRIRIGTTKTRTGCLTCKQRRIKCDEGKPSCQKCLKSGRACGGYPAIDTVLKIVQYTNAQPFQNRRIQLDGQDATKYSTNRLDVSAYWTAQGISVSGSAFCIPHIGGLRTEPFNALPISSTGDVQEAFDNLHVLQFRHMNEPSRHYYASLLLNDPMFFETMIAFSKLTFKYSYVPQERMTADIRSHIGNVLQQLTPRVPLCQVQSSDAVVLTIYYLLVVCQAAGDFEAFGVHLNGLKRISANRPAVDFHCFDGFMSARIQSAELVANFLNDKAGDTLVTVEHPASKYPTPPGSPAPPQLGVPRAFQALAASGRLSAGGINFLQNVDRYLGRPYRSGSKDRRAALLALRMIESLEATNYPAHALNIERPNNVSPRNSAELCKGYEVEAVF